jgi:hypothetical protein
LYCFRHRSKIRFALSGGKFHSIDRGVETFSEPLWYVCVLLAVSLMFALRSTHSRRLQKFGLSEDSGMLRSKFAAGISRLD